ncbi:MAG: DUF3332 domain-containing protein [Candidatus Cloacimonetes bacterium]|jgi:hypothetical protein|nr:DUF3332 domain-containing protein [Candidatus Cloacimonadota bacterium]MDD2507069.1 DUF3332 domain-containing protein [Candidatus Cloacimonadota bacterium]MDD4147481.1 DUF3332 domain-containing protein [Candidatus Cloacimonadota bacterium]MDD4559969.1 DUF3332 domain-containing protein [Candidatus Cloacimonadota bacterium]
MDRIVKLVSMALVAIILTVGVAGCFGNFAATRKVYEFNETFGDKWVNTVMFWVLSIVPVYSVASFADVVLFNTIEFWTGSNPIAMGPNDEVIKYASEDGKNLKITIRQNEVLVEDMDNPENEIELSYKPLEKSWYYQSDNGLVKIASLSEDKADFITPTGKVYTLNQAM